LPIECSLGGESRIRNNALAAALEALHHPKSNATSSFSAASEAMPFQISRARTPSTCSLQVRATWPRSRPYFSRSYLLEAADDFFLQRRFCIFIDGVVQTVDQAASQIRAGLGSGPV